MSSCQRPNRSKQSVFFCTNKHSHTPPLSQMRSSIGTRQERDLPAHRHIYDVSSSSFRGDQHTKTRAISSPSQSIFSGALHRISCFSLVAHHRILILASIVTGHRGLRFLHTGRSSSEARLDLSITFECGLQQCLRKAEWGRWAQKKCIDVIGLGAFNGCKGVRESMFIRALVSY